MLTGETFEVLFKKHPKASDKAIIKLYGIKLYGRIDSEMASSTYYVMWSTCFDYGPDLTVSYTKFAEKSKKLVFKLKKYYFVNISKL